MCSCVICKMMFIFSSKECNLANVLQMVVVNLFALCYFSGKIKVKTGEEAGVKKDEEKLENTKG